MTAAAHVPTHTPLAPPGPLPPPPPPAIPLLLQEGRPNAPIAPTASAAHRIIIGSLPGSGGRRRDGDHGGLRGAQNATSGVAAARERRRPRASGAFHRRVAGEPGAAVGVGRARAAGVL